MGVDEVLIGRGQERKCLRQRVGGVNRLDLRVPGRSMSSTHARIMRGQSGWILEDARSTNGSAVNGRRVERALLHDGDVIELGHTVLLVENALPTPPDTAPDFEPCSVASVEPQLTTLLPELGARFGALARVARSRLPVLVLGETGTGKELVARAIHRFSQRNGPFVAVNCGAIPSNLVESQLFGHAKGAFTGATRDEVGCIRAADGGTLLLDEVGDLAASAQPALLRVLQEREVMAVGSTRAIHVDVRIVAATHRNIDALVERERFRKDLLARIDDYRLELPPLRCRRMDIGCLIASVLRGEACPTLSPEAGIDLVMQSWPCNIRELVAAIRRAIILSDGQLLQSHHLNPGRSGGRTQPGSVIARGEKRRYPDDSIKEELISRLTESRGNIAQVARDLGKARMQVHRWMKRYGIEISSFRTNKEEGSNSAGN
jgi:DNA-binding NtrC family response regulator